MNKLYPLMFCFLLFFTFSCKSVKDPEFRKIENLQIGSIKQGNVSLSADAIFFNPNKVGVTLKSIDLDVFVKDIEVGKVKQSKEVEVPALQEVRLPLYADIATKDILGNLGGVLGAFLKQELEVHIKGKAVVKAMGIPVSVPVNHVEMVKLKL